MKRYFYKNFDRIIKIIGMVFLVIGVIIFLYSLRPRIILLMIGLLHIGSGIILLKIK